MRITRLQVRDLGRHRDLDITLAPGFTIVRGPNEAGKSTIQRAFELALFLRPTAATAELGTLRSWGAGPEDRPWIRLEFEDEDQPATEAAAGASGAAEHAGAAVRRGSLEKEFRGSKGRVLLEIDGERCADPARAEEIVARLTGIPNEKFFRSTASIRHEEIDDLDRDEATLRDRLQSSIGGGDRGSSRARSLLEAALRSLRAKGEKNPGRLRIAEETVARAGMALGNGETALARLEADRDTLAVARASRARVDAALAESRNLLESARQAERLRADRAVVAERYERLRSAADARRRLAELQAVPGRPLPALNEQLGRLRSLNGRVSVMAESMRDGGIEVAPDEPVPGYAATAAATAAVALGGVAAIVVGVLVALPIAAVGALLMAAALLLSWRLGRRYGAARDARGRNEARARERTLRRQGRVGTEEGLRVAQAGVATLLRELGVPDAVQAERLLADEQARLGEVAALEARLRGLLGDVDQASIPTLRDRAALELEQKTAALEALGPIAADARARERLEAEVRDRTAALERARDAEAAASARIEANAVDAEQVAAEAERLATWRDELAALRRRVRLYEATLAAIVEAESATMRSATRFLEAQVGRDIATVTGGRYERVRVDDATLDLEAWSPERGDWVGVGQLSKGTLDQLFLAARIGLVRLVTQGRRPPLVLDDPFVTFDDERAARATRLLRDLSADFQVIYLTCSSRYDELADAVVELPGPAANEPRSAGAES
jgi:DNA repair exonuclease SbcCD ATPase subunit